SPTGAVALGAAEAALGADPAAGTAVGLADPALDGRRVEPGRERASPERDRGEDRPVELHRRERTSLTQHARDADAKLVPDHAHQAAKLRRAQAQLDLQPLLDRGEQPAADVHQPAGDGGP